MTSKNIWNAPNASNSNEKAIIWITCWSTDDVWKRPKCWKWHHTQWKINDVHQLMTSKNIWNAQNASNATNRNEKAIILITCWSTDDIWKRFKCWKCNYTQWQINHFHQLMTSKNVWNAANATNSNEKAIILITCWLTDGVWKRPKCWKCYYTH